MLDGLPFFTAEGGAVRMDGAPLQLKGVSWFGAEGDSGVPDGLWERSMADYLDFLAELGVNPRDWLIARKRQRFRRALRDGSSVAEAIYGAGYGSPSRVYENSDRALGMTPATYAKGGAGAHIDYTTVESDYGRVLVAATEKGIAAVFLLSLIHI